MTYTNPTESLWAGGHPATPVPKSISVKSQQPTLVSTSHNLRTQSRTRGAQRWQWRFDWGVLPRSEAMPLLAFALSMRGQHGTFYVPLHIFGNRNGCTGNATAPLINAGNAGDREILVGGLIPNASFARAGNFVQFSSHDKVYMLVADVVPNAGGIASLMVEPALSFPVQLGGMAKFDAISARVRYATDDHVMDMQPGEFVTYSAEFVEAL